VGLTPIAGDLSAGGPQALSNSLALTGPNTLGTIFPASQAKRPGTLQAGEARIEFPAPPHGKSREPSAVPTQCGDSTPGDTPDIGY
jgi:hypothetical protein